MLLVVTITNTVNKIINTVYSDLGVARSQEKIYENFAIHFLKPKANKKCFIVIKYAGKGLQKSIS